MQFRIKFAVECVHSDDDRVPLELPSTGKELKAAIKFFLDLPVRRNYETDKDSGQLQAFYDGVDDWEREVITFERFQELFIKEVNK